MDRPHSTIRVLVVNAKPMEQSTLRHAFPGNGYHLTVAQSGREALRHIEHFQVDVIVLDSAIAEPDGWRTRRLIRARSSVPIIMLINPSEELGRRRDLDPDEFVVKPLRADDVAMRAQTQLRRRRRLAEEQARQGTRIYDGGRLAFDLDRREVRGAQGHETLTVTEYKLFLYLTEAPGILRSPEQIVREVWGTDFPGQKDNVKVHIANLRRKLDSCVPGREYIEGRRGHGYMFVAEPFEADPPA